MFIHGTASSSGRWADLVNDLQSDPVIRDHFQFWWFSYSTGNPSPFSALRLRTAIEDAVHELDPKRKDSMLRQIVLIGHSQGGLLAKMLVIDKRSRKASAPIRSWACPGVSRKRSGLPRASTRAWILGLNPPLLRPIA